MKLTEDGKRQMRAKLRELSALLEKAKKLAPLRKGAAAFTQHDSPAERDRHSLIGALDAISDSLSSGKCPNDRHVVEALRMTKRLGAVAELPRWIELRQENWKVFGPKAAEILDRAGDAIEKAAKVRAVDAQAVTNLLQHLIGRAEYPARPIVFGDAADSEDLRKMRSGEIDPKALIRERDRLTAEVKELQCKGWLAKSEERESELFKVLHMLKVARRARLLTAADL